MSFKLSSDLTLPRCICDIHLVGKTNVAQRSLLLRTCREPVCCCIHVAQNSDVILALQLSMQQELESNHSTPHRCQCTRSYLQTISLRHQFSSTSTFPPGASIFIIWPKGLQTWTHGTNRYRTISSPDPRALQPARQHSELSVQASGKQFLWNFYLYLWDCRPLNTSELKQYLCFQNQRPAVFQPTYSTSVTVDIYLCIYLQIIPQSQILLTSRHPSLDAFNVIISVAGL